MSNNTLAERVREVIKDEQYLMKIMSGVSYNNVAQVSVKYASVVVENSVRNVVNILIEEIDKQRKDGNNRNTLGFQMMNFTDDLKELRDSLSITKQDHE